MNMKMESIWDWDYASEDEICPTEACEIPRFKVVENSLNPVINETGKEVLLGDSNFVHETGQWTDTKQQAWLAEQFQLSNKLYELSSIGRAIASQMFEEESHA